MQRDNIVVDARASKNWFSTSNLGMAPPVGYVGAVLLSQLIPAASSNPKIACPSNPKIACSNVIVDVVLVVEGSSNAPVCFSAVVDGVVMIDVVSDVVVDEVVAIDEVDEVVTIDEGSLERPS